MYTFRSRVRYSECDEHARLSLLGLIDYFQDCSGFHTESTARNMAALTADGLAWMVAASQLQIQELPSYGEHITVRTWNYAHRGIMADRCYELVGEDGRLCAQGDTKWFLYSFEQGRPVRISDEEIAVYASDEPRTDMPPTKRKLSFAGEGTPMPSVTVVSQMLDTNHHVNNAQYVEIARTEADIATADIASVHVQFAKMALLGDEMRPLLFAEDARTVGVSLQDAAGDAYANVRFGLKG